MQMGSVMVVAGAQSVTVIHGVSKPYHILGLSVDWDTTLFVTSKTDDQFTVAFGNPAPANSVNSGGGTLMWSVQ